MGMFLVGLFWWYVLVGMYLVGMYMVSMRVGGSVLVGMYWRVCIGGMRWVCIAGCFWRLCFGGY